MSKQLMKLSYQVGKENLYYIESPKTEIKIVLIRYPFWEAYSSAIDSEIWIRIKPNLNLRRKSLIIGDEEIDEIVLDDRFFETIPDELQALVIKFFDSHWDIIKASLFLGDDFLNLLKINPSFAFLITNLEVINPAFRFHTEYELLTKLIRTKQRKILAYAMLPYTNHMRKLFSKFDITIVSRDKLTKVCNLLVKSKSSVAKLDKLISHIESINENLITMMSDYPELIISLNHMLTHELINSNNFLDNLQILDDLQKRCTAAKIKFPKINSMTEINGVYTRTIEKIEEKIRLGYDFIEPPIQGDQFIKPIRSSKEQRAWGRKQQNCIAGLINSVIQEKSFFYSINFYGEQATLELNISTTDYKIIDLKGNKNSNVSTALRKHVKLWLEKNKKAI